jgi:aryl-alcohol dehydrogenase-like predicted oxidoreductase
MARGPLKTKELGSTGLEITRVGLGAWAIGGGGWLYGWGPQDDAESLLAMRHALDCGVTTFVVDNAEEIAKFDACRARVRLLLRISFRNPDTIIDLSRKFGCDADAAVGLGSERELEESLVRLGLEAVDLYQIHWPIPDDQIEEGWAALLEFRDEGLTRYIGVCNFSVEQLRRVQQTVHVETLQPPYSLIARDAEDEILPFAEREGIGVIVYSPMGSGLLSGAMTRERIDALPDDDWRRRSPEFSDPRLAGNLALVERLRTVAERHGTTPGAVAIAWTLRNPAVDGAIVGLRGRPGRPDRRRGESRARRRGRRGDRRLSVRARPRAAAAG